MSVTSESVAILGGGSVATAIGGRMSAAGVDVVYGLRDPAGREVAPGGAALPLADVLAGRELVVLAVPASAAADALRSAGGPGERIVIDCTNPLRWDGGPVWDPPSEGSVAAHLTSESPRARVVKGINHFGAEVMREPYLASSGWGVPALFAGDDAGAKARIMELAGDIGFDPRDAGPLRNAAVLENLVVLWVHLATVGGAGRSFAFDLAEIPPAEEPDGTSWVPASSRRDRPATPRGR